MQLALNGLLQAVPPFLRPRVVATVVVPIVVYVMLPLLQRVRSRVSKR
ncbi:hypothetical protein [Sphaerisporangium fuscum]|nr:hypothetical protein [Sphaerisporangium fuscum]